MRFGSPPILKSGSHFWVLQQSFTKAADTAVHPATVSSLLDSAGALDLLARLGGSPRFAALDDQVEEDASRLFRSAHQRCTGLLIQQEWLCDLIARTARDLDMEAVLLKGMALHFSGHTEIGTRSSCDVDVLVPRARVNEFQNVLIAAGLTPANVVPARHQLVPLLHPSAGLVEVHRMILGVRLSGCSATFDDVVRASLCERSSLKGVLLPSRHLLLAHLLVHGVAQHGMDFSYPLTRLIGDVIDMGVSDEEWEEFLGGPYRWIARDVREDEVLAVADLAKRLEGGEDPAEIAAGEDGAGKLLRHIVLGATDHEYRESVRLQARMKTVAPGSRVGALFRLCFRVLWLERSQVESLYGTPKSWVGYWGWRLWRPFDVVGRAWRYATAWVRRAWRMHFT